MGRRDLRRAALTREFEADMQQRPNEPPDVPQRPVAPVTYRGAAEHHCCYCQQLKPGRFVRGIRTGWSRHMTTPVWACFDCEPETTPEARV